MHEFLRSGSQSSHLHLQNPRACLDTTLREECFALHLRQIPLDKPKTLHEEFDLHHHLQFRQLRRACGEVHILLLVAKAQTPLALEEMGTPASLAEKSVFRWKNSYCSNQSSFGHPVTMGCGDSI